MLCVSARAAVVSACTVLMVVCFAHAELTAKSYVLDGLIALSNAVFSAEIAYSIWKFPNFFDVKINTPL